MDQQSKELLDSLPTSPPGGTQVLDYTNYSQEQFVYKSGGMIYGQWSQSFAGACQGGFPNSIPEGALKSLDRVGNCPSGASVLRAVHM